MNYKSINTAILTTNDTPKSTPRDRRFYDYLLDNNVAYYYALHLAQEKTAIDRRIIEIGAVFNHKFLKTLKLISTVCKENEIKFLLFKTYKYIPEITDGDIDLFVREEDFYNFLKAFERKGFTCFENESLKAICRKEGFCNVEPRVNASFHGLVVLKEEQIWKRSEQVSIGEVKVFKVTKEVDLFYLLLEVLYRPSYIRLYLLLLFRDGNLKKILSLSIDNQINQDLRFLFSKLKTGNIENRYFPQFLGNLDFMAWWSRRVFPSPHFSLLTRLKHIIFFFYSKYSYRLLKRIVFRHYWEYEFR